jgi:3-hydroxybutyryl-CoA dehydrogenase
MTSNARTVAVLGGGTMGAGIAVVAARAGHRTILRDISDEAVQRGLDTAEGFLRRSASLGKLTEEQTAAALANLSGTTELRDVAPAEVVIEAVFEDPEVKGPIFRTLDALLPETSIIASNTSSIPIAQLASWTERPQRVAGLHFFSPVPVMDLVEVVVGLDTSDETVQRAEAFVTAIGKTPIRTKDRSGFIVNMLLVPYLMAAVRMYEDGFASREDIDQGMRLGAGHPMGPLTLCDFIGLDVLYAVCDSLYEEFKRSEYAPPPLLKRMVVSGHHGRKTGRGFYEYAG